MIRTSSCVQRWRAVPVLVAAALFATASTAAPDEADEIALVGSAKKVGKEIQLDPSKGGPPGAAWRMEPISLQSSFRVKFEFSLLGSTHPQADGIALVIQTDGTGALGDGGGGIGYEGLHGVASVIQTYFNNHVGLNLDSNPYDAKRAPADLGGASLVQGGEVVTYDALNHVLSMRGHLTVDGVPYVVHDRKEVDLASLLGSDTATIGMTGGTGANMARQRVADFRVFPK